MISTGVNTLFAMEFLKQNSSEKLYKMPFCSFVTLMYLQEIISSSLYNLVVAILPILHIETLRRMFLIHFLIKYNLVHLIPYIIDVI
jgi:hypothetical protein